MIRKNGYRFSGKDHDPEKNFTDPEVLQGGP
jgi:hypothetical protein